VTPGCLSSDQQATSTKLSRYCEGAVALQRFLNQEYQMVDRNDNRGGNNRGGGNEGGTTTERDGGRHNPNSGKVMDPAHDGRLKENRGDDRGGGSGGSGGAARGSSNRDDDRGGNNRGGTSGGTTTERDGGRHNPNSGQVLHPETDRRLKENGGDGRGGDDDRGGSNRGGNNRGDDSRGGTTGQGGPHPAVRDDDKRLRENRDDDDNRGGNNRGGNNR
jgi:hypothetical protein